MASAAAIATRFGTGEQTVSAAAFSDMDILNFALNLEYLGAEFYCVSTWGVTLASLGVITSADESGPTTGGNMVPNFGASPQATIAAAIRSDEIAHVKLLRSILGSAAVKKPAINLDAKGTSFFSSVNGWLELARQFEDVDLSAYLGTATMLSSSTNLATAGQLLATESQHEGALRWSCVQNAVTSPALDAHDVAPTPSTLFDVNSQGLSLPRTPAQVLNLVYAGGNCSGGFFPNGMNGGIVCQSSS
jgi:hypothetical protein